MSRRRDIDTILRDWKYTPGEVTARLVRGHDGREVVQLRVDLGLLQLEVSNRPDGTRPGGAESYYDYLVALAVHHGDDFKLNFEQCAEVDREFAEYYQRRLCWLALREFPRAVRDADHSLAMMDFVRDCSPDEKWTWSHEQYRPFILFHRAQASAMVRLETDGPEAAIEEINQGLRQIHAFFVEADVEEEFESDDMVERLHELRENVRQHYDVGRTLVERLSDAIALEQYELAAEIRDEIARREMGHI